MHAYGFYWFRQGRCAGISRINFIFIGTLLVIQKWVSSTGIPMGLPQRFQVIFSMVTFNIKYLKILRSIEPLIFWYVVAPWWVYLPIPRVLGYHFSESGYIAKCYIKQRGICNCRPYSDHECQIFTFSQSLRNIMVHHLISSVEWKGSGNQHEIWFSLPYMF